jgi:hypothetical protein
MASKVSIANRALSKLGEDRILLLTDDSKPARTINQMFDDVLDSELRKSRWNFSISRTSLSALVAAPAWGYKYQYPLPSDFLALVQVGEYYVRAGSALRALWSVEAGSILTDMTAPLKIRYVQRVSNPGAFDPMFAETLACRLAMEACETLTQSETKFNRVAEQYKASLMDALRQDSIENPPDELPQGSWLDSRGYAGSYSTSADGGIYPSGVVIL